MSLKEMAERIDGTIEKLSDLSIAEGETDYDAEDSRDDAIDTLDGIARRLRELAAIAD